METSGQTYPARGHGEGSSLAGEGDSGDDEALGVHFGRLWAVVVKRDGMLLERTSDYCGKRVTVGEIIVVLTKKPLQRSWQRANQRRERRPNPLIYLR